MATSNQTATPIRAVEDLSGPAPVPLLGNLIEFRRGGVSHRVLERWCDTYGPTYRFYLARYEAVVTADPEVVDAVLRRRPGDFRRSAVTAQVLEEAGVNGVFTAEGDRWRRLRRIATQSLNAAYLRQYFSTITRVTERLTTVWEAAADAGTSVDVLDDLMRYTLDVISGLAMGHDLHALDGPADGLHRRVPQLFTAFERRMNAPLPYWRYVRLPQDRRLAATVKEIESVVRDRFAAARSRMATGVEPANFLEALVKPLDGEPDATDEEVLGNVLTMLVAGEDTTSSTAAWVVHYLAENPDVHRRVRAEADEVLGTQQFPTDPATVGRLRYAEAVVHEALRMRPAAPYFVMQPTKDVTLDTLDGKLHLPGDTLLFLLTSHGALRDRVRFPDPQIFRPERWLDPAMPAASLPFAPFGGGPRFCPGRNLALIEATVIGSVLSRAFDLIPDRAAGPVGERMSLTLFPTNLKIRLHHRDG